MEVRTPSASHYWRDDMLTPNNFRTQEQREAIEEQAAANRALMATLYTKPKPAPQVLGNLHRAVIAGDIPGVLRHLTRDAINQATVTGLTPLHLAAFGYARIVDTPAWCRAQAANRKTVQEQIVDLLIERGARVDAWDHAKRLPAACCEGKRLPASLVEAMERLKEETSYLGPWNEPGSEGGNAVVLNAFLTKNDGPISDGRCRR